MATVFSRIQHYCNLKRVPLPDKDQRSEIGKQVAHIYISEVKKPETKIVRAPSIEPEGTFQAISYPRYFIPVIDKFIDDYMAEVAPQKILEQPRKRKRIPYNKNK